MEKSVVPNKDLRDNDENEKERERLFPSRTYSILEDEGKRNLLENGQRIETF